jgi:mono/diheme cytochrome c family protein
MVVLGIGVPVAVIAAVKDRDSVPEANVSSLNASEQRGRQLFGDQCRNCHTLAAANSTARVGPNLDDLRPPPSLVLDAIEKGRARGNGQMAADLVEGQEAKDVAAFIATAVGQTDQGGPVE